jgi:hypothetical protein
MVVDQLERQALVGDDPVEVLHQVGLGHRRQLAQAGLVEPVEIDAPQPLSMPWGAVNGVTHELA